MSGEKLGPHRRKAKALQHLCDGGGHSIASFSGAGQRRLTASWGQPRLNAKIEKCGGLIWFEDIARP